MTNAFFVWFYWWFALCWFYVSVLRLKNLQSSVDSHESSVEVMTKNQIRSKVIFRKDSLPKCRFNYSLTIHVKYMFSEMILMHFSTNSSAIFSSHYLWIDLWHVIHFYFGNLSPIRGVTDAGAFPHNFLSLTFPSFDLQPPTLSFLQAGTYRPGLRRCDTPNFWNQLKVR